MADTQVVTGEDTGAEAEVVLVETSVEAVAAVAASSGAAEVVSVALLAAERHRLRRNH